MTFTDLNLVNGQIVQQGYGTKANITWTLLISVVCIYVLRFPEVHGRTETHPFSIRQCLVYHQHSTVKAASFLMASGTAYAARRWLSDQVETAPSIRLLPWRVHVDLLDIAVSAWRPYIAYLSERIDIQVRNYKKTRFSTDSTSLILPLLLTSTKTI